MKATASSATLRFWDVSGRLKPEITLALTDHVEQIQKHFPALVEAVEKGKGLAVTIEPVKKKRSLDANAYLWVILQKMAESLLTTKNEIYRKLIKDVGQCYIAKIRPDVTDEFIRMWNNQKGLGRFAELESEDNFDGYNRVVCYFGSSVYDTKQMSVLIDEAVTQAQEIGIETLPPGEIEALKNLWEG